MEVGVTSNRFIIICAARTGSTMLRNMLNSHSRICCHGEVITPNPASARRLLGAGRDEISNIADLLIDQREKSPEYFLDRIVLYPGKFRSVGVKFLYNYLLDGSLKEVFDYLRTDNSVKIIHLKRANRLRRLISLKLLYQSGVANVFDGNKLPSYEAVTLSASECVKDFEEIAGQELYFDTIFSNHEKIDISYEELIDETDNVINNVLRFLAVDPETLLIRTAKLSSGNVENIIENYRELKEALKASPYLEFFDGEPGQPV